MHHNLLMLINFLPVDVDHTSLSSCENESGDVADVDGLMYVVEEEDAGSRTQEWVGNLTDACVDKQAWDGLIMDDESEHTGDSHPRSQAKVSSEHNSECTRFVWGVD